MSIGAFCPNLEDPEIKEQFEGIVYNLRSEDLAYHFWDKHQGDIYLIYEEIAQRQEEEYYSKHPDPKIQADIDRYGADIITNINNSYVWEIEKKLKLTDWSTVDGKSTKKFNTYTNAKADRLINEVHKLGGFATKVEVKTNRGAIRKHKVIVSYDIYRDPGDVFMREGANHVVVPEDRAHIQNFIDIFSEGEVKSLDVLRYLDDNYGYIFNDREDLAAVYDLVRANSSKMKGSTVLLGALKRDGYMVEKDGHIVINTSQVLRKPNLEYFVESMLHEMVHVMTEKAMKNPETEAEKKFKDAIEEMYFFVANNDIDVMQEYGMTDPMEFLAEMHVDRKFANEMSKLYRTVDQADTRSIFRRFLDALLEFLGVTQRKDRTGSQRANVYDLVRNSFEVYLKSSPSLGVPTRITVAGRILDNYEIQSSARINNIAKDVVPGQPETIKKAIFKMGKDFSEQALKDEHKYIHLPTGLTYQSTTEYLDAHGFGFRSHLAKDPAIQQRGTRAKALGTTVHVTLEGNVNDIVENIALETGFSASAEARKELAKIIDELKKDTKSVIALSEVIVADTDTQRAGTIDLVLIDNMGRIRIYDFKTRERGFGTYQRSYDGSKTQQQKHRMQLSFYKHMLEKMLGIQVTDMNVVMLRPEIEEATIDPDFQFTVDEILGSSLDETFSVQEQGTLKLLEEDFRTLARGETIEVWTEDEVERGIKYTLRIDGKKRSKEDRRYIEFAYTFIPDTIASVALDRSVLDAPRGIDTFNTAPSTFQGIYGERPLKLRRKLSEDQGPTETEWDEMVHEHKLNQSRLSEVEQVAEKAKEALIHRLEIITARFSFTHRKSFEDFVDTVLDQDTATDTLLHIIKYAAGVTSSIMDEVTEARDTGFTIEKLNKWTDYLIAYDSLDDILDLMVEDPNLFKDPKIVKVLQDTIINRNKVKKLYKSKGIPLIAEWLTPYYDKLRRSFKDSRAGDYRVKAKRLKKKGKSEQEIVAEIGTEEQYVDAKLAEENESLDKMTYEYLREQLVIADNDINVGARWFDTILDSSDAVVSAMVNAFMEADDAVRLESIEQRTKVLNMLRELEQAKGKGAFESEMDFYSFALEKDEKGKPLQYLITPWKSAIHEEERLERQDAYRNYSKQVAKDKIKAWKAAHLELNKADYHDAFNEYLITLLQKEQISQADYDTLLDNLFAVNMDIESLSANGKITEDAASLALGWLGTNRWKYSEVHEDFVNPQWAEWMKTIGIDPNLKQWEQMEAVEKSDHIEARFYTFILKMAEEADSKLPFSYKLGTRLPGVAKISSERIKEGQNPGTYFSETIKADMFIRPEDTERGNAELTDEHGNPKYFLPIHYTAKIEPKNQSFDLAGIYYRYWQSALDYEHKKQILSKMEMAKKFVDERSAKKRDSLGKIIKRAARTTGVGDQKEKPALVPAGKTQTAAQLHDWFMMAVYGKQSTNASVVSMFGKELDVTKLINALTRYTSLNLLAFNTVQATANVILGETMQKIDSFAGEHVTPKSMLYGTDYYMRNLPKMMGDVGSRNNRSTASLLIERFDILHESVRHDTTFSKRSRVGQVLDSSTLFWLQGAGEHWLQSRFLFALLHDKRAFNSKGEDIGPLVKQYYSKDGVLKINDEVDLAKSKWTEKDQQRFKQKVKGLLTRMHGEYSDLGKVAAQRYALGQLAYQFRKFIVPGIRRRYGRRAYIQRLDQFTEGNYRTTFNFIQNIAKDLGQLNLALMTEDWTKLSKHEKANIRRTMGEVITLLALYLLVSAMWKDDDDEEDFIGSSGFLDNEWLNHFMEYQALRLSTELGFFIRPKETLQIMRSPMASMSVVENTGRFFHSLFNLDQYYERGPWTGERKITKNMINFVPVYRQYYKARDVGEQIPWLR